MRGAFSIESTNACKGVALILLLWHHLFRRHPEFGFLTHNLAIHAKVCVAIFVILSGYGYSESIKARNIGLFEFYKKRLLALYLNYWFISLIFVPIGVFFMGRSLHDVFSSHVYARFFIQMTGLHRFFYNELGYNSTWWYMSVIIPLTILFPFIFDLTKKYGMLILIGFFIILMPNREILPTINTWLLPFALGIFLSQNDYIAILSKALNAYGYWRFAVLIIAISFVAYVRPAAPFIKNVEIDWLFGGLIILFVFEICNESHLTETILSFLGSHLFNIFLFHTFIFLYYFNGFIYSFKNPVIIFFALLITCVLISLAIELIKKHCYFYKLLDKANSWQFPDYIEITFQQDTPADTYNSHR